MTTNYKKGRNYEYYVKEKLEKAGFFVVRSAGSHGVFDLIAVDLKGNIYGIQVRKNGYLSKNEIEEIKHIVKTYKITPILAHNKNGNGWSFEFIKCGEAYGSDNKAT